MNLRNRWSIKTTCALVSSTPPADFASDRLHQAAHHAQQRRLATPIGPGDVEEFSRFQTEANIREESAIAAYALEPHGLEPIRAGHRRAIRLASDRTAHEIPQSGW